MLYANIILEQKRSNYHELIADPDKMINNAKKFCKNCTRIKTLKSKIKNEEDEIINIKLDLSIFEESDFNDRQAIIKKYNSTISNSNQVLSDFGYKKLLEKNIDIHREVIRIYIDRINELMYIIPKDSSKINK